MIEGVVHLAQVQSTGSFLQVSTNKATCISKLLYLPAQMDL